ncbi:unnamed protein product [Gadus morhua 'NCC']
MVNKTNERTRETNWFGSFVLQTRSFEQVKTFPRATNIAGITMLHGTLLSAFGMLLLHVSPLRSVNLSLFKSKIRSPEEGAIRLAGSKTRSQGRVEVYLHGEWGTVCHNAWDLPDAQVVCRQLHFKGAVSAVAGGTFGEGTGQIWLDQTKCVGTENSLSNCSYNGWGLMDCSHKDDAGVICVAGRYRNYSTIRAVL